jgi:tetratricopeptide (TPR) repeat protein
MKHTIFLRLSCMLALLTAASSGALYGQEPSAADTSLGQRALAFMHSGLRNYQQNTETGARAAVADWRRAAELFDSAGVARMEGIAWGSVGLGWYQLGQQDSALAAYWKAHGVFERAGLQYGVSSSLHHIGIIHRDRRQFAQARAFYGDALHLVTTENEGERSAILSDIGLIFADTGNPDSAMHYFRRALDLQTASNDTQYIGNTLGNIANVFEKTEAVDSALAYYHRALAAHRRIGGSAYEVSDLRNIGIVFSRAEQFDSAYAYFRQAREKSDSLADPALKGDVLEAYAAFYSGVGNHESALEYGRVALDEYRKRGVGRRAAAQMRRIAVEFITQIPIDSASSADSASKYLAAAEAVQREMRDSLELAYTLAAWGHLRTFDDDGVARNFFREALKIADALTLPDMRRDLLNSIGVSLLEASADSARFYYRQSLLLARATGARSIEADILSNIGVSYHEHAPRDLVRAVAYFDSAAAFKARLRGRIRVDANRLSFMGQDAHIYESWASAWLERGAEVGRERGVKAALGVVERGRARALLDLMGVAHGDRPISGSAAADTVVGADPARFLDPILERAAATGAPVISYSVAPKSVRIWLIQPSGQIVFAEQRVERAELERLVLALRRSLNADSARRRSGAAAPGPEAAATTADAEGAAVRLRSLLLPPEIAARLPPEGEIVLVPGGVLNLLPFAALPADAEGVPLGLRYALRYAPSLSVLAHVEGTPALGRAGADGRRQFPGALVVADPRMPVDPTSRSGRSFDALLGARAEGARVAGLLSTTVVSDSAATESRVRALLPSAPLVHFASHAVAYNSQAMTRESLLALTPDASADGYLKVAELMDDPALRVNAELVVLSACQTGLGNLNETEGTVGFQRAFLARGARSVIVTLWSVNDDATGLLMERFYRHWLGGTMTKAEALRQAQRDLVKEHPRFADPYFWAGFQVVGAR